MSDYQGIDILSLYDKVQFGTQHKCVDYACVRGVLINRFHCIHGVGVYKVGKSYSIIVR